MFVRPKPVRLKCLLDQKAVRPNCFIPNDNVPTMPDAESVYKTVVIRIIGWYAKCDNVTQCEIKLTISRFCSKVSVFKALM